MRLYFNDFKDSYSKQAKVALGAFLLELPNLILTIISGIMSGTLIVWTDCFQSLESTIHCGIVFLIASMLKKDIGDRYNYGSDRLESFISFICDLLVLLGYFLIIGVSIYSVINPSPTEDTLWLFLILKSFNIAFDIYLLLSQKRAMKNRKSQMSETELKVYRQNLISDIVIGAIALICFFLKDYKWSWYISPIASIILSIFFLISIFKGIKEVVNELSDASIPLDKQDGLMDIVLAHAKNIKKIYSIDCRILNHIVYIDINIDFRDDVTYEMQKESLAEIEKEVKEIYPDSVSRILIRNNQDNIPKSAE